MQEITSTKRMVLASKFLKLVLVLPPLYLVQEWYTIKLSEKRWNALSPQQNEKILLT